MAVQFNGVIVELLVEAFIPLKLRPLAQQNLKLRGQIAKFYQWVTGGHDKWYHFLLIPKPVNPGYGEIEPYADSEHILSRRGDCATPSIFCHLPRAVTESSKSHFIFLTRWYILID